MSYAEIDSERIRAACEAFIAKRNARIEKVQEENIESAMKPYFFGLFKRTREEAIETLRSYGWSSQYNTCTLRGWCDAQQVEKLLVLANNANGAIMVSSDDAEILEEFL